MNTKLKPVISSNIEAAGYNHENQTLVIKFKSGGKYKYPNVPAELYKEFEATFDGANGKSAGKFFHARLKSLPCEKIED